MNITQQIEAHRSIRKFTSETIDEVILTRILEAAARAPTGGSMHLYSIIVTQDPARRETLAAVHLGSEVIRNAPVTLTFCVDVNRMRQWLTAHGETSGVDNMWGFGMGFSDAMLAAQNALLEAESLGLGGCFQGSTFVAGPVITRVLGCPSGVVPIATLVLGHPAEDVPRATRLPIAALVHREVHRTPSNEELAALYKEHAESTFERFGSVPYVAAAIAAAGVENLPGYYARLMYPGDLIETAAAYFTSVIQSQGFCSDAQVRRTRAVRVACASSEIGALNPLRQLVFALALASGHMDDSLATPPVEAEAKLLAFLTERDPTLFDELARRGPFDTQLRAQLKAHFEALPAVRNYPRPA